jgi:hypothetical protein
MLIGIIVGTLVTLALAIGLAVWFFSGIRID